MVTLFFFPIYFLEVFVYIVYPCRSSEASTWHCVIPGGYPPQDWQSLPCAGEELDSKGEELDSMGRSWIRGSLYIYSCKLLTLLALCSESTAPFFVPLPNPHCPLNFYSSFLPTHVITMNTGNINMPECSSVEHNTAISPYQYWWISSVASWKWKVQQ
jgi:hypothetical protein